jgi:hypothetical protein
MLMRLLLCKHSSIESAMWRNVTPLSCQAPPVELNAVTRTARRDRVTVIDLERLRNIAFKSDPCASR